MSLLGFVVALLQHPFISIADIMHHPKQQKTVVLDDQGEELFCFENERRRSVSYNMIPQVLVDAFIAAEDKNFFSHHGLSLKGVLRSLYVNFIHRKVVQGASTITQQVARLLFLTHQRTFSRKIKEIFIALQLEKQLSKQQIFELYVNNIYFGRGIYGIEAASQKFWKKPIHLISVDEAATLAAVAKSARFFSPLNDQERALKRRNIILTLMHKHHFISHEQFLLAKNKPLELSLAPFENNESSSYYKEWIRLWAEQTIGHELLYNGKLIIQTTLNFSIQKEAEKIFFEQIQELRKTEDPLLNGGLVVLEGKTGAIKATIGGYSFKESQFNRCFQAYRQMGSTFKPFLYAAALLQGISLAEVVVDEPWSFNTGSKQLWTPQNWNKVHVGSMTHAQALVKSNNIIAAKLLQEIGYEPLLSISKNAGLYKELKPIPALALGTVEATVIEAAAAFSVFAHHGFYTKPYLIASVKNDQGKVFFKHPYNPPKTAIPPLVSDQINSVLQHQISTLDARTRTQPSSTQMIGKTGSTNNAQSMWFIGSTPAYTTAIYIGRDDNVRGTKKKLASKTAYPIWRKLQDSIPQPEKRFSYESSLKPHMIDAWTGTSTHHATKDTITLLIPRT